MSGAALRATGGEPLCSGALRTALQDQDSTQELSFRWFRSSGLVHAAPSFDNAGGYIFRKLDRSSGRLKDPSEELDRLEAAGIHIAGFSRARVAEGRDFVVVHIVQRGHALREPQWLPAALHRPSKKMTLAGHVGAPSVLTGADLRYSINRFLTQMGVTKQLSTNGQVHWPSPLEMGWTSPRSL